MAYRLRMTTGPPTYLSSCYRRTFATTAYNRSAFFQLGALSNSRETSYFNKFSGLSRVEHSPNLQLIRSSEVKPMETSKRSSAVSSKAGSINRKLVPITKVVVNKGAAASPPPSTPSAKDIVRTVGKGGRIYGMRLIPALKNGTPANGTSTDYGTQTNKMEDDQIPRSLRLTALPKDASPSTVSSAKTTLSSAASISAPTTAPIVSHIPQLSSRSLHAFSLGQHILHRQQLVRRRLRTVLRKRIVAHRADKRAFVDAHYASFRAIVGARLTAVIAMTVSAAVIVTTWTNPEWVLAQKETAERGWRNMKGVLGGFLELGGIWGTRGRDMAGHAYAGSLADTASATEPVADNGGKQVLVQTRPASAKKDVVRGPAKISSSSLEDSVVKTEKEGKGSGFSLNDLFWSGSR